MRGEVGCSPGTPWRMKIKAAPLLCELHAHTTWSDGAFFLCALTDLYGRNGFDVLTVTDHAPREQVGIHAVNYDEYLAAIELEADRAWELYRLFLVPGLELTYYDPDLGERAHAVALGLCSYVEVGAGVETMLRAARAHGAAIVATHPYSAEQAVSGARHTARFERDREQLAPLVDRYELFNRETLFSWVAESGLPLVATGDFHRLEHLAGWKTMLHA